MSRLICLTDVESNRKICVNIDQIIMAEAISVITMSSRSIQTRLRMSDGFLINVKESLDELLRKSV